MKAVHVTLLLFALPALAAGIAPGALIYDRAALLQGEWWRLWTGHWVHFSGSHLAWNLGVLIVAGTWLERLRPSTLLRVVLVGAPVISIGLLMFAPTMAAYGGLSGLATGVVLLLALVQMQERPAERAWWIALVMLVAGKIAVDAVSPAPLFSRFAGEIHPSALAHLLGGLIALPLVFMRSPGKPRHVTVAR
jgi:rhomboid family GlyGly-CTERM serine protease